jgi:heme/copper-type cytochrome/quinol oxidase subunit 3
MSVTALPPQATADAIRRRPEGRDVGWWGIAMFILTEASLFGVLILSYFYLRFYTTPAWPPDGIESPTLRLPVLMTVVLVASSIPIQLAVRAARRGEGRRMLLWQLLAMGMGLAFLVMQYVEYHDKLQHFTARTDAYGSLFYLITGLHGAHVAAALVMSGWCLLIARGGRQAAARSRSVESMALYWHFVDALWLVIFCSLYLSAAL